jgi:Sec-independent protein secretion pathway component TatC
MNDATKRSILRWVHIVVSIPIIGYIYSPFEDIPNYAPLVRFVFVPVIVFSGIGMWIGRAVRRSVSEKSEPQAATETRS